MKGILAWAALAVLVGRCTLAAVLGPPKEPYQDQPEDQPCSHVEQITAGQHQYVIVMGGTVDGTMTRSPIGYAAFVQRWQPNRSVLIENVGTTDVINPWLTVNGRGDWRTLESIVAEATHGYTSDADRARAIWEFARRHRFHACTWDRECSDAVKAFNVYGYTLCGNQAQVLSDLWRAAGLETRRCFPVGHCTSEVFYDGDWHMMDSDEHVICLLRDNQTIASAAQIVRDHDLVKRTHTYGINQRDRRQTDEFSASLYFYDGPRGAQYPPATTHTMNLVLRPGESIELRWDHIGKQYTAGRAAKDASGRGDGWGDLRQWGPAAYDNLRNGKLRYRPDLGSSTAARGAAATDNAVWDTQQGAIRVEQLGKPARITWRFASPYVFVGGRAEARVQLGEAARASWRFSPDGRSWTTVAQAEGTEADQLEAVLDAVVSPRGQPMYAFQLQLELHGRAVVQDVGFEHDIQTAALSLPELTLGRNNIMYIDETPGPRRVKITHRWLERRTWHPPDPPRQPVTPADGAVVEGTRVSFAWSEPSDPDGDRIVDYHFELSAYPDMRWPLSPNFEKRISRTSWRGEARWTVPYTGLLNPDTTYYWRVRAQDSTGVWGPWSRVFRFSVRAPGVPLDVHLEPDNEGGLVLRWRPNPLGRKPVAYKVYGSDEKGFTVSDQPYDVFRGRGFVRTMQEFENTPDDAPGTGMVRTDANFVARTEKTSLRVVGAELTLPNTNRAFYRVVAVDERGNESGPSDYAAVPVPYVCSRPGPAQQGKEYRYQPAVIRSLGDLRCRRSPESSYNAAFWDRQQLTYEPVSLPEGLSLDPCSGLVFGLPAKAGTFPLVFDVHAKPGTSVRVTQQLVVEP